MKLVILILTFAGAFILGQKSIMTAYDPRILEDSVAKASLNFYMLGCVEGAKHSGGDTPSEDFCLSNARANATLVKTWLKAQMWNRDSTLAE